MKKYIIIGLVVFTNQLIAQQIVSDRPGQTEASSTIPKGSLQMESGAQVGFIEDNVVKERQVLAPVTLFRYGLTNGIEIRVFNQLEQVKNQINDTEINGISDLEIGTKVQLLKKDSISTKIVFLSHLVLPTGSTNLTNGNFGTINKLSISHKINEKVNLGYNLIYNYFGTGNGDVTYTLSFSIGISEKVGIYMESYGGFIEFENYLSNFDAGMTYLVKNNLQLDFSFGTGVNNQMNYISAGFSWNIKRQ